MRTISDSLVLSFLLLRASKGAVAERVAIASCSRCSFSVPLFRIRRGRTMRIATTSRKARQSFGEMSSIGGSAGMFMAVENLAR